MFNLIKYEFKKNRMGLIIMALIFLALEGLFLYGYIADEENVLAAGVGFLVMYVMVAFFYVMFIGISNYEKDLTHKSGYLVYMTPNSSLKIIFSKFLYVLIVGALVCVIMGGTGIMDLMLFADWANEEFRIIDILRGLADGLGVDFDGVLLVVLMEVIAFVIDFFSILAITYFAVTLSVTVLNNSKLRTVVSVVLTLVLLFAVSWINNKYISPEMTYINSFKDAVMYLLPETIFNTVVVAIGVGASAYLTDKAISL